MKQNKMQCLSFTLRISLIVLCGIILPSLSYAQECKSGAKVTDSYLADNNDGTISDSNTGLMWQKCSLGQTGNNCTGTAKNYTWEEALEAAESNRDNGYNNWRLPNIKELQSIVEPFCGDPSINAGFFLNTSSSIFYCIFIV